MGLAKAYGNAMFCCLYEYVVICKSIGLKLKIQTVCKIHLLVAMRAVLASMYKKSESLNVTD